MGNCSANRDGTYTGPNGEILTYQDIINYQRQMQTDYSFMSNNIKLNQSESQQQSDSIDRIIETEEEKIMPEVNNGDIFKKKIQNNNQQILQQNDIFHDQSFSQFNPQNLTQFQQFNLNQQQHISLQSIDNSFLQINNKLTQQQNQNKEQTQNTNKKQQNPENNLPVLEQNEPATSREEWEQLLVQTPNEYQQQSQKQQQQSQIQQDFAIPQFNNTISDNMDNKSQVYSYGQSGYLANMLQNQLNNPEFNQPFKLPTAPNINQSCRVIKKKNVRSLSSNMLPLKQQPVIIFQQKQPEEEPKNISQNTSGIVMHQRTETDHSHHKTEHTPEKKVVLKYKQGYNTPQPEIEKKMSQIFLNNNTNYPNNITCMFMHMQTQSINDQTNTTINQGKSPLITKENEYEEKYETEKNQNQKTLFTHQYISQPFKLEYNPYQHQQLVQEGQSNKKNEENQQQQSIQLDFVKKQHKTSEEISNVPSKLNITNTDTTITKSGNYQEVIQQNQKVKSEDLQQQYQQQQFTYQQQYNNTQQPQEPSFKKIGFTESLKNSIKNPSHYTSVTFRNCVASQAESYKTTAQNSKFESNLINSQNDFHMDFMKQVKQKINNNLTNPTAASMTESVYQKAINSVGQKITISPPRTLATTCQTQRSSIQDYQQYYLQFKQQIEHQTSQQQNQQQQQEEINEDQQKKVQQITYNTNYQNTDQSQIQYNFQTTMPTYDNLRTENQIVDKKPDYIQKNQEIPVQSELQQEQQESNFITDCDNDNDVLNEKKEGFDESSIHNQGQSEYEDEGQSLFFQNNSQQKTINKSSYQVTQVTQNSSGKKKKNNIFFDNILESNIDPTTKQPKFDSNYSSNNIQQKVDMSKDMNYIPLTQFKSESPPIQSTYRQNIYQQQYQMEQQSPIFEDQESYLKTEEQETLDKDIEDKKQMVGELLSSILKSMAKKKHKSSINKESFNIQTEISEKQELEQKIVELKNMLKQSQNLDQNQISFSFHNIDNNSKQDRVIEGSFGKKKQCHQRSKSSCQGVSYLNQDFHLSKEKINEMSKNQINIFNTEFKICSNSKQLEEPVSLRQSLISPPKIRSKSGKKVGLSIDTEKINEESEKRMSLQQHDKKIIRNSTPIQKQLPKQQNQAQQQEQYKTLQIRHKRSQSNFISQNDYNNNKTPSISNQGFENQDENVSNNTTFINNPSKQHPHENVQNSFKLAYYKQQEQQSQQQQKTSQSESIEVFNGFIQEIERNCEIVEQTIQQSQQQSHRHSHSHRNRSASIIDIQEQQLMKELEDLDQNLVQKKKPSIPNNINLNINSCYTSVKKAEKEKITPIKPVIAKNYNSYTSSKIQQQQLQQQQQQQQQQGSYSKSGTITERRKSQSNTKISKQRENSCNNIKKQLFPDTSSTKKPQNISNNQTKINSTNNNIRHQRTNSYSDSHSKKQLKKDQNSQISVLSQNKNLTNQSQISSSFKSIQNIGNNSNSNLKQYNNSILEQIKMCKDPEQVLSLWNQLNQKNNSQKQDPQIIQNVQQQQLQARGEDKENLAKSENDHSFKFILEPSNNQIIN